MFCRLRYWLDRDFIPSIFASLFFFDSFDPINVRLEGQGSIIHAEHEIIILIELGVYSKGVLDILQVERVENFALKLHERNVLLLTSIEAKSGLGGGEFIEHLLEKFFKNFFDLF